MTNSPDRANARAIVVLSFAVLFQELALIRWLPAAVRVIGYFPNLVLLSAFLGLGVGCLRAGRRSLTLLWPVALFATLVAGRALHGVAFTQQGTSEHLWLLYFDLGPAAPVFPDVRPPIVLFFALGALSFVGPGQLLAERLDRFTSAGRPLTGYGWDLTGSLLGVVSFAVASFSQSPPRVWFLVLALAMLPFFLRSRPGRVMFVATAALGIWIVGFGDAARRYSPYYALEAEHPALPLIGTQILANGSLHQIALDVASRAPFGPQLDLIRKSYRIPYRKFGLPPKRVLILGAGTGNDVAVALAEGAEHIDAVEIDPVIRSMGDAHPNAPYASPRVTVHVTDARAFLNRSTDKYDLIIFATLDSMTRLSALAGVRLDNFVYTVEALRAARAHLAPDGGLALYFMVGAVHIHRRILANIYEALGTNPTVVQGDLGGLFNSIYMAGPRFEDADASSLASLREIHAAAEPATDDWPYFYMEHRGVSGFYLSLMAILMLISAAAVLSASPELRASLRTGADLEMFLLGAAFLLLETKSVTEMALVWGVTWLTSAVVFGSILLMALGGTLLRRRVRLPDGVVFGLLSASLLGSYFFPTQLLTSTAVPLRLLLSILFVGGPILWAASVFAAAFEVRPSAAVAFGWNLLGAVVGGLLEFSSMALGIKALHLIALAAYLGVALVRRRSPRSVGPVFPAETS